MGYVTNLNGTLLQDKSLAAFYSADKYDSNYDCLINQGKLTGDKVFGAYLYSDRARVYGGVAYFPGTAFNYFTTPDNVATRPTTEIEIVARLKLTTWAPATEPVILAKNEAGANRSFSFTVATSGALGLSISTDGSNNFSAYAGSGALFNDNVTGWLKVTRRTSDGLTKFYKADDTGNNTIPTNWTQIGADQNIASGSAIAGTIARYEVGSRVGGNIQNLNGNVYYLQMSNTIASAPVLKFDPSNVPNYNMGWTSSTGEIWTTKVSTAYQLDWQYKVAPAQLGSAGFYTNARIWGGKAYISPSNYFSTPNSSALNITGDIDIRMKLALNAWTGSVQELLEKGSSSSAYRLRIETTGAIGFYVSSGSINSGAIPTVVAGQETWIRATRVKSTGLMTVYQSYDGINWIPLNSAVVGADTPLGTNTDPLWLPRSSNAVGSISYMDIRNNVLDNGTGIVCKFDPSVVADRTLSWTSSTGEVWTVNKTTGADSNDPFLLTYSGIRYAYMPYVSGNYISTPDSVATSITGDIDIRALIHPDSLTGSGYRVICAKWSTASWSYFFAVDANGKLFFTTSPSAGIQIMSLSTGSSISVTVPLWVRVTRDVNNDAGGNTTTFYTSTDGVNWTQLGTPVVNTGTTSISDVNASLEIGSELSGTSSLFKGKIYQVQVYNGINGTLACNFDASLCSQTGYTDSINNAVWTVNRSATGRKVAIVDRTMLSFATDDYIEVANHPLINFGASQPFGASLTFRDFGNPTSDNAIFGKRNTYVGDSTAGYMARRSTGSGVNYMAGDGTNAFQTGANNITVGVAQICSITRDSLNATTLYNDSLTRAGASFAGSLSNTLTFRIGASGSGQYWDGEAFGCSVFRKGITPSLNNRLKTKLKGQA